MRRAQDRARSARSREIGARSAQRDDQIARPRRAQACERSERRAKRAARKARDKNMPAKRADFFFYFHSLAYVCYC